MGVLRMFLFFVVGFWVLRIFFRYLLPFLLKIAVEKAQKNGEAAENNFQNSQNSKEGKTYIYKKPKRKNKKHKVGDYVDYEEME